MAMKRFIAVLALMVFIQGIGATISCYTCDDCRDSIGTKTTGCTVCGIEEFSALGVLSVKRTCKRSAASIYTLGCDRQSVLGVGTDLCYCDTNLCNTNREDIQRNIETISCYTCEICGDSIGTKRTDCTVCGIEKYTALGVSSVKRTCEISAASTFILGCSRDSFIGVKTDQCYCGTNLCNTAMENIPGYDASISCYTCDVCGDSIGTKTTGCTVCGKMEVSAQNSSVTQKTCEKRPASTFSLDCDHQSVPDVGEAALCYCDTELCNGATAATVGITTLAVCTLLAALMRQ